MSPAASLFPCAAFQRVDDAPGLCERWGHYLGPCDRPFGVEHWALFVGGEPVCVAVSASTIAGRTAGVRREECVELARLCRHPDHAWSTRVALRLWREVAAPQWSYWPVRVAFAYSKNDRHDGRTYRFDGWENLGKRRSAGGGGTWTKKRAEGDPALGSKTLWAWRYAPMVFREVEAWNE